MGRLLRLLIIVAVIGLALVLIRRALARRRRPPARDAGTVHAMVTCAHCGLHLPESEAVPDGARWYCGQAHRNAGPRR